MGWDKSEKLEKLFLKNSSSLIYQKSPITIQIMDLGTWLKCRQKSIYLQ